jgi:hypothetical protein
VSSRSRRAAAVASLLTLSAPLVSSDASSEPWRANPSLSARIESAYALQTRDGHGQKFHNKFYGELLLDPTPNIQIVSRIRISTEVLDNLDPGSFTDTSYAPGTYPAAPGQVTEFENRELFLQWSHGPLRVRAGKQQLVWGEADGIKVLDVLNPQDFREYILPNFSESRIPLWSLDFDIELGGEGLASSLPEGSSLQMLFLPDPSVHHIPDIEDLGENPDAPYAPTSERIVPKAPTAFATAVKFQTTQRSRKWKSSNFDTGARLAVPIGRTDVAFYYIWRVDDFPVTAYGPASIELSGTNLFLQVPVTLDYRRHHMAGASTSSAIGDWVIRSEFSYTFDREISWLYEVPASVINDANDQVDKSDDIAWVVGLDWFGASNTLLSAQIFQNIVVQHDDAMLRRKFETAMTFLARRKFMNDRLSAELVLILGINDGDGLVRPRLEYEWTDILSSWIAGDVFYGTRDGYFGQYNSNDRMVFGVSLGWTSD